MLLWSPWAVPAAAVEGLQAPAWLIRAEQRQPLRPGTALAEADVVETGADGRLLIRLADGSRIKLGADTRLELTSLQEDVTPNGLFRGSFTLAGGMLRFVTAAPAPGVQRELDVQLATTYLALAEGDVWTRNRDDVVTVCLIAGQAKAHHPALGERALDQPSSFLLVPAEGEPHPVAPVDANQLQQWTAETELVSGQGVLLPGGGWSVQLSSHASEASARQAEQRLLALGLPVELTRAQLKDRTFYRLRVSGFDSQQDARSFADRHPGPPGGPKPWVTCNAPGAGCR
jgi:hypothetical protein